MKNTIKISRNREKAYWVCAWFNEVGDMPFVDDIPYFIRLRAVKNAKRWNKKTSLFNALQEKNTYRTSY